MDSNSGSDLSSDVLITELQWRLTKSMDSNVNRKNPNLRLCSFCALQHFRDRLFQQAPPSRDVPVQSGGSSAAGKGPAESHGERQNGADREKIVSSFYCVVIQVI